MTVAPTITTERLVLRPHLIEDFAQYAALFASERAEYMGTLKRRHAWYSFTSDVAQWALLGHGAWAIQDRESSAFLGQVAILKPDHFPELELGWFLLEEAEGKGLAFEAAAAAKTYATDTMNVVSLVSYIAKDNHRSIRLAERLGAHLDANALRDDPEDLVYRHEVAA